MDRPRFSTVVFDLDGTLADTGPDLTAALNHALAGLGRPRVEPGDVRDVLGHGARALLRRGLSLSGDVEESDVERGFPALMGFYEEHICDLTRPYPGLEQALADCRSMGIALSVCTNKPEKITACVLDALGWSDLFANVVAGETLPVRKPHPGPVLAAIERAGGGPGAFVGDSIVDSEAAKAAGVPFVAVSFGFSDRPVEELGADAIIDHFDELIPALARL